MDFKSWLQLLIKERELTLYILVKIIHILTMIFFVGVVSFRTFIMPVLKSKFDKQTYGRIDKFIGQRARSIIKINNLLLIASGLYLFSLHVDSIDIIFLLKVGVGLVLASAFYIVPMIMKELSHIKWFSQFFHYLYFSLMIIVVVLSQLIFT
jgi:hypothetical protein